ncbi:galactokinase family protein [Rothia sp. ZJ1223]|uniref:galactokinase n=1 Tax=Rothia sp. ZJ1223 TaxID=2811098 RepID=UPI001959C41D|nr:galactokinase [Rothia sp. ZJ1223]
MTIIEPAWASEPDHKVLVARVRDAFVAKYGVEPDGVWSAPGRLNLLGEYIDFLGGSCMPMPLPYRTYVAGRLRRDGVLRAESVQMPGDERTVVIRDIHPGNLKGWFTYVAGVAWSLNQEAGDITLPAEFGADLMIDSNVPVGGGLSSSAAIECSTVLALMDLSVTLRQQVLDASSANGELRARLAQVCIRAENKVAGAHTGGLDQTASLRSTPGQALVVDFRDFSLQPVDVDLESAGLSFLVVNTNTPHELAGGEFAARRAVTECATQALGLAYLRDALPDDLRCAGLGEAEAKQWRLAAIDDLTNKAMVAMDSVTRCTEAPRGWVRHAFHDMCLVERAAYVISVADAQSPAAWSELGNLFTESFVSMRDELQVSRPEINTAVDACLDAGALGARIVGGGFGGAVMALVEADSLYAVSQAVADAYAAWGYASPEFLPMSPGFPAQRDH